MADMIITPATQGLVPQLWSNAFFKEYVRDSRFNRYMGKDEGAMIQLNSDLTRRKGDTITFAAVRRALGAGVTGDTLLEGNEEILDSRSMKITVNPIRHAMAATDWDEQRSTVPLYEAMRSVLKTWAMEKLRNDVINALTSFNNVQYAQASATQLNTWLVQNYDRVLFGSAISNNTNVMSTSLQNVSAATGKLTVASINTAKRLAKLASPRIRPITVKGDQEWYILWAPSYAIRDLRNDPAFQAAYQYAADRGKDNILFTDDDIIISGVIVKELPELNTFPGVGSGGQAVAPCFLCGAQAIGIGWAQMTKTTMNVRDYGFRHGVGVQEIRGIQKLNFGRNTGSDTQNLTDNGVVTIFASGLADT